jgi:hypothetical protein
MPIEKARQAICNACAGKTRVLGDPDSIEVRREAWRSVERIKLTEDEYDRSQALLAGITLPEEE